MRRDEMRARRISGVTREAPDVVSLHFRDYRCSQAKPGQYLMIWIPPVDEVPMSLSTISADGKASVTVRSVGEATRALCGLNKGDKIGVRGPFGNGYTLTGEAPLLVAGGTGVASLTPLAEAFVDGGVKPVFVVGAKTEGGLVFRDRLESLLGGGLVLATDDGTCGFEGLGSECAFRQMDKRNFDAVYTCGPEPMMASVFREADARGIPVQASLERYVKCAVGLCGSCAIGPYRVCKDGPVFDSEMLRAVRDEFGSRKMDPTGRQVPLDR